ncbi:unnamed protein product [Spirodela intermedia]|uniref:RanBP2-type domain-containing protein n=1 Tax=Spirodela intermedia TaxID=51605 RepID=A0A7I8J260_SPIIN|nr:unnamed protein product [Spirodela intermedia]CAA6664306.1 unnamed protein product [Spirodela intermedia]
MAVPILLRLTSPCSSSALVFRSFYVKAFSSAAFDSPLLPRRTLFLGGAAAAGKVFRRRPRFPAIPSSSSAVATACSRFELYNTSSPPAGLDEGAEPAEPAGDPVPHQWPEWETFLEMLKTKGHFDGPSPGMERWTKEGAVVAVAPPSLPVEDIQAIVECGCPSIHRKPTNSGKRLRAYLMLNESDVCGGCSLRGSCDRANLVLKDEEGARTVDIVRIILCYAADPSLLSRFEASRRGHLEGSIRSLLSKLSKLSDTPVDPALREATRKRPSQKEQPRRSKASENARSQNVEMKRGDWVQFPELLRNLRCMECGFDGPKRVDFGEVEMKKGDWTCPEMPALQERRPQRELNPGEWECPSCDFLNYRRNKICLKCSHERPSEEPEEPSGEHLWKRPAASVGDRNQRRPTALR